MRKPDQADGAAIGRRIAFIRRARGLTTRELARRVGVSQVHISRLEAGRQAPRSETLIRLAEALRVEPYELLLPADAEGRPTSVSPGIVPGGVLREALRDPEFVNLLEEVARAWRESPETFRAFESVLRAVTDEGE